jgi:hypothetical protein
MTNPGAVQPVQNHDHVIGAHAPSYLRNPGAFEEAGRHDVSLAGCDQSAGVVGGFDRAIAAGAVRADLTGRRLPLLACGIVSTMYLKPGGAEEDRRRHLDLILGGIRANRR